MSVICQLIKLRELCQPRIESAIKCGDQFGITRWASLNNYFADLELSQIRREKHRDYKTFRQLELVIV